MNGAEIATEQQYAFEQCGFDTEKLEPGDILLSRIPMNLNDTSTWDSHLIQSLTRSRFSFAALHLGNGLFIEAVGSGIARLPIPRAGVRDVRNVRLLRVRKGYEWVARRAAANGLRYLQRGFCQAGAPYTKCSTFHNVRRASVTNSGLIASAYLEADTTLIPDKSAYAVFPGDFLQSPLLENVTTSVLQNASVPVRSTFYLDDDTLSRRAHHWEVATQLKVLCNHEVRRILDLEVRAKHKPSSLRELEQLIAQKRWNALDKAVQRSFKWYRYAEVYQVKQSAFFGETMEAAATLTRLLPAVLNEERLAAELTAIRADLQLLEAENAHWSQQRDYYTDLMQDYPAKTFAYMHDLYTKQIAIGEQLLQAKQQQNTIYQNEARRRGMRLKIA